MSVFNLNDGVDALGQNIAAAEKARDSHLEVLDHQLGAYTSPWWRGSIAGDMPGYAPDNVYYEAVRTETPSMVFNAPRVRLNSRVFGLDKPVARMQKAINQWVLDTRYDEFLTMPATELQFCCPVTLTTLEPHPSLEIEVLDKDGKPTGEMKPAKRVVKSRISPRHYFYDPDANHKAETEFEGHKYKIDLERLKDEAREDAKLDDDDPMKRGWILSEVEGLTAETGVEEFRKHKPDHDIPDRNEVVLYDVWLRNYEESDHPGAKEMCFGSVVTLAYQGTGERGTAGVFTQVSTVEPYYGHPEGPYNMLTIHYVPDDVYGLAPAIASEGEARDLNRHARGASDSAARYKRLILCDNTDPDFAEKVQVGEHDLVLPIEGIEKGKVMSVEIGGITEQNLAYLQLARERYDRTRGSSETNRGQAPRDTTATASALAQQAADIGTDYQKLRFTQFVRRDLEGVLVYFWKEKDIRVSLGPDAAQELGIPTLAELVEQGVPLDQIMALDEQDMVMTPGSRLYYAGGEDEVEWGDLALEIEPMSMEHSSEGLSQRRALEMFQIVMQVAQAAPAMPHVRWEEVLDKLGDAMNVPELGTLLDLRSLPPMPPAQPQGGFPAPGAPVKIAPPPSDRGTGPAGVQMGGFLSSLAGAQ